MRNSSDILCLKEPKIGENDGSELFSVDGSCSSRINRRNRNSSNVLHFEMNQDIPENRSDLSTAPEEASEFPHASNDNNEEISEQIGDTKREEEKDKLEDIPKESGNCSSMKRLEQEQVAGYERPCEQKIGKWVW